jgi:hypothetical protein
VWPCYWFGCFGFCGCGLHCLCLNAKRQKTVVRMRSDWKTDDSLESVGHGRFKIQWKEFNSFYDEKVNGLKLARY